LSDVSNYKLQISNSAITNELIGTTGDATPVNRLQPGEIARKEKKSWHVTKTQYAAFAAARG